jgi:hypothetical protein
MKTRKLVAGMALIAVLAGPGRAPAMAQRTGDFELEIDTRTGTILLR